uniref:C2H2-type domain-containing protein n=1 Tax=Electrophorus electricus TaxID=8005 RepID=A0A4W4F0A9_ELEEL
MLASRTQFSPSYVPHAKNKVAFDEEHLQDDGLSMDGQDAMCNEEEEGSVRGPPTFYDSPCSNGINPDAGYASPLSDTSDQIPDFKSTSSKDGHENEELPSYKDNRNTLEDSLAQMKAVYANLISDASWSTFAMDITKPVPSTSSSHSNQKSSTASISSSGTSNGGSASYDWHQAALAKTLQHTPYHLLPESSLFSTVQLYRQNNKLYGSVFTGASKFRCKDCSAAYDTLVGLTVHMNETGHYRDDNKDKEEDNSKRWSKPRKRSLMEMEGKEDAQKVLKCMYCGHSFESLQDLSVHMIKTKHYQKVPLKEPVPALATKLVPSTKKRPVQDPLMCPCSPESLTGSTGVVSVAEVGKDIKGAANPYVTPNNRYGYQNGASYTWQFEARKAQILKCMECGSSHDTLQQLTAHMMVTGHFLKVTNTASKKGKQLVFDAVVEEKIQSIPLPPTTTRLPVPSLKSQSVSPPLSGSEIKKETEEKKTEIHELFGGKIKEEKEEAKEKEAKENSTTYKYLREEDLEETPKGGMDILKSLENTVSSAISKAQTGTPTWGGYPSIHAAYQLQGSVKSSLLSTTVQSVPVQPAINSGIRTVVSDPASIIHSPCSPSSPPTLRNNVSAMEELVEKVTGKASVKKEKEEQMDGAERRRSAYAARSPTHKEKKDAVSPSLTAKNNSSRKTDGEVVCKMEPKETLVEGQNHTNVPESCKLPITNGNSLGVITDHLPETSFISPISALQSVMNTHLSKASKLVHPPSDPLSMLYRISNNMMEKSAYHSAYDKQNEPLNTYFYEDNNQPIDLRKFKSLNSDSTNSDTNSITSSHPVMNIINGARPLHSSLPLSDSVLCLRENALMDISDMVKNLTGHLTPKSSTPSSISEKSDADSSAFEDPLDDFSSAQKRKGRQSNWNPQHLLILQAQFASSLRQTPEGRYAMTDLGPQERVHICKFTGLSMTTVSHWLANVKYQLRRTGGTKFLKNMDSSQPVFLCGDCASQFRTPSSYISHLESHLGFSLKDLSKLSVHQLQEQQAASKKITDKIPCSSPLLSLTSLDEDSNPGYIYQCRLCNRTFVSKHAIKLHLSKTHGKTPEDHLVFVTPLEKLEKEEQ